MSGGPIEASYAMRINKTASEATQMIKQIALQAASCDYIQSVINSSQHHHHEVSREVCVQW